MSMQVYKFQVKKKRNRKQLSCTNHTNCSMVLQEIHALNDLSTQSSNTSVIPKQHKGQWSQINTISYRNTPIVCHTNSPGVFGGKPGSDDGPLTPGRSTGGSPGIPG